MNYTYDQNKNTYTLDGTTYRSEDFFDRFRICNACQNVFPIEDTVYCESDGEDYCEDCADLNHIRSCAHCGSFFRSHEMIHPVDSSNVYCCDCAGDRLSRCARCGDYYEDEDRLYYDDDSDDYYCEDCYDIVCEEHSGIIRDYHTFKNENDYHFYGSENRSDAIYMGFELEVDKGNDREACAEAMSQIFQDFVRYENDGSLSDGFEMISQPASIGYHLSMADTYREAFRKAMNEYGFESHDAGTCGLHIHIDKEFFEGKEELASSKLLFLFSKFWKELVLFSRRSSSQLHWCDRYSSSVKETIKAHKEKCLDRYKALNLINTNTIEIRLWRGTLNIDTFLATLSFTARLATVVKETPAVKLASMNWEQLLGDDPIITSYWDLRKYRAEEGN